MGRLAKNPHIKNARSIATSVTIPRGTTNSQPSYSEPGAIRFNTEENQLEYRIMSPGSLDPGDGCWVKVPGVGRTSIVKTTAVGDGVTDSFWLNQPVQQAEDILVFIGGVYQEPGPAYYVDQNYIFFSSPPPNGEIIVIMDGYNSTDVQPS